jgi:2-polyprenyl-6-methoxyphenol hydroxylase-like FAD-dependent oxidoreductase
MKYEVVVIGASVGGCTAAILYARHGLNVALVEKATDLAHYKKAIEKHRNTKQP